MNFLHIVVIFFNVAKQKHDFVYFDFLREGHHARPEIGIICLKSLVDHGVFSCCHTIEIWTDTSTREFRNRRSLYGLTLLAARYKK